MIFLTVGTQFPFDRLVRTVDDAVGKKRIKDEVFAQIGQSAYHPRHFSYTETLAQGEFLRWVKKASAVIGHAGMGTIATVLDFGKPLLVMPRLKSWNEVVNDHQVVIARMFEEQGYLLAAYDEGEFATKVDMLMSFVPKPRGNQAGAVCERIATFLADAVNAKGRCLRNRSGTRSNCMRDGL